SSPRGADPFERIARAGRRRMAPEDDPCEGEACFQCRRMCIVTRGRRLDGSRVSVPRRTEKRARSALGKQPSRYLQDVFRRPVVAGPDCVDASVRTDERGGKVVRDLLAGRHVEHAEQVCHAADLVWITRGERPGIAGAVSPGVGAQDLRRIVLRVDTHAQEAYVFAEPGSERLLKPCELLREERAIVREGAAGVDERHEPGLAVEGVRPEYVAVLR